MNEKDLELVQRVYRRNNERHGILRRAIADAEKKQQNAELLDEICAIAEHLVKDRSIALQCGRDGVNLHRGHPLHYKLREAILDYLSMEE